MSIRNAANGSCGHCRQVVGGLGWCGFALWLAICGASPAHAQGDSPLTKQVEGKVIFQRQCASCHGEQGQGDEDAGTEPFEGSHKLGDLTRVVEETMPEDDPDACVGDDAKAVARFIYDSFYAKQAAERESNARIELSRLTVRQYDNAVADLLATFLGEPRGSDEQGLDATYHNSKGFDRRTRVIQRRDKRVAFDFQEGSPEAGKIGNEEFAIRWQGAVLADETGDYEFCVVTENGMKLWVNDAEVPLIDAWVASGGKQEHRATLRLLGGRL